MYEMDPHLRLVKAEAILLETLSKLVWVVSFFYGVELVFAIFCILTSVPIPDGFPLLNRGEYLNILFALIVLAIILKVLGLVDKHIMEYWKRQDTQKK